MFSTPWRIPQAAAKASVGHDALTKCGEMTACAHIYRVGMNGYETGVGWVATMDRAFGNDRYAACDDG